MSWWSYSHAALVRALGGGPAADIVIVDDRDVLERAIGTAEGAIDHYLDQRPVYVVRLERDLPALAERYDWSGSRACPARATCTASSAGARKD